MKNLKLISILCLILFTAGSCKKSKIDKNLNGTWILSELIIGSTNQVTSNTSISLKFSNVTKGEGLTDFITIVNQGTYYTLGKVSIDKKYEKMEMTFSDPGSDPSYEGIFTVSKSNFEFNGTYSNSNGDFLPVRIKGTK